MTVESALVVRVASVGAVVGLVRRVLDPTAGAGMPPHVTVLYPFLDPGGLDHERIAALSEAIASVPSFSFRLAGTGWFDDRVVYLRPEPAEPFRRLTAAIAGRFPECPPYGGAFGSVVPHVTVAMRGPRSVLSCAARIAAALPPIEAVAEEVLLMSYEPGGRPWRADRSFPLG
ncbi:MAG: 2'-5' RNA ligase family protein [Actinomycetota bacterium]|nr:2'-5' RNA ligase family protein [Actinomycetota bacterium]